VDVKRGSRQREKMRKKKQNSKYKRERERNILTQSGAGMVSDGTKSKKEQNDILNEAF
jgi:hypothetical protein